MKIANSYQRLTITCKECKREFEHIVRDQRVVKKEFCARCIRQRQYRQKKEKQARGGEHNA